MSLVPDSDLPEITTNPYDKNGKVVPHPEPTPESVGPQVGPTYRQTSRPTNNAVPEDDLPAQAGPSSAPVSKPQGLLSWMQSRQANARKVLTGWEANTFNAWKDTMEAVGTGVSADLNILGTPGREVSGITQAVREGPLKGTTPLEKVTDLSDRLDTLNNLIWHPTPERINSARKSVQQGLHLATDDDIDTMMHGVLMSHLGQLKPYVANTLKTVNNVGTDTIVDPFAWSSDLATVARDLGLGDKLAAAPSASHLLATGARHAAVNPATKPLIKAGVTAGRMVTAQVYNFLKKHGAGPAFEHLASTVSNTQNSASKIFNNLHDTFVVRPDLLHMGLTPTGRDVRIQLENAQRVLKHKDYISRGGEEMSPEELKRLNEFHRDELARKSNEIFSPHASGEKLTKGGYINWHMYKAPPVAQVANPAKTMANLGRAGIEMNPLPHGVGNVGTLSFLGGGLDAVTRGVAAMVKPIDHAVESRLINMGSSVPEYIGGHMGGLPGYSGVVNKMSGILRQMEHGWRAGMLEHLDRVLGPSEAGTKAEYIKGALINRKLGDYKSLTAFARAFASYGGPYVAYKLGVLPRAVIDSIRHNPINFETAARAKAQIQENREGSKRDKLGGSDPVSETQEAIVNPFAYVANTALMGVMHDAFELANDWINPSGTHETFDQGLSKIAGNHFAPLGLAQGIIENAQGKSFAGQPMSFADHVAAAIIGSLNYHIHHSPSQKNKKKNVKYINRHAFTPEN